MFESLEIPYYVQLLISCALVGSLVFTLARASMVRRHSELKRTHEQLAARLETELDAHRQSTVELQARTSRVHELETKVEVMLAELQNERAARSKVQSELEASQDQYLQSTTEKEGLIRENALLAAGSKEKQAGFDRQMAIKNEQFAEIKTKENKLTAQLTDLQLAYQALTRQHAALESTLSEKEAGFAQQLKALANQETVLKENFENLANRILENKGRQFNEKSKEVLDSILVPFKQQMDDFKKRVEDMHVAEIQKQSELDRELANLKSMNLQMTAQAHNLAVALQGQKKMQGNWGELVLENVLERSGLQLDKDYKREQSFSTENGRSRPDVVVYLPQGKHLIIDAKVSLNAYTRFVNSEEDAERSAAISEHTQNIANRIKELSNRHYYALPGLKSPEMVFMFIPIESAFVEALKHDEMLFQKAIEQNVLVATPTTLLTSLNIVAQLWRFEDQNRNTAELAERAGKIYDKLNAFVGNMQSIGRQLDRAKEVYDKAFGQLVSGRGNLIKQASDFKKLGISIKSELPGELVDKAELESEAQLSIEPSIETAIEPDFDRRP